MDNKNTTKKTGSKKTVFFPVAALKHAIEHKDGHMVYTDTRGNWLYVSEDGQTVAMYNNIAQLIKEIYRQSDDEDYIITGWDMDVHRFTEDLYGDWYDAYERMRRYYIERFE